MWNVIIYNFEFDCLTKMDNNHDFECYFTNFFDVVTDVMVTN